MGIVFETQASTTYGTRTNTTITAPSGIQDNDILIGELFQGLLHNDPGAPTLPSGWAAFDTDTLVVDIGGFRGRKTTAWKRASSESGDYTFIHASRSTQGWIGRFSGCITSGTPLSVTSTNTSTGTTTTGTDITTGSDSSFLLFLSHHWADTTNDLSAPNGMTEMADLLVLYNAYELRATAGATGNRSHTNNNVETSPWACRMVELLADLSLNLNVEVSGNSITTVVNSLIFPVADRKLIVNSSGLRF